MGSAKPYSRNILGLDPFYTDFSSLTNSYLAFGHETKYILIFASPPIQVPLPVLGAESFVTSEAYLARLQHEAWNPASPVTPDICCFAVAVSKGVSTE